MISEPAARKNEAVNAVPRLPADASIDDVETALREQGCAVVERLVPDALLDGIEQELEPYLDATAPGGDEFSGRNTRRTGCLLARSRGFGELAAHPLVLGALDRVLGDHATSYQLHLTQVIEIGPGEPAQLVHRDQWAFDFFSFPPRPPSTPSLPQSTKPVASSSNGSSPLT